LASIFNIRLRKGIASFFLFSQLISCSSKKEDFFMRYRSPEPDELNKEITRKYAELTNAKSTYHSFYIATELAEKLTMAEREKEAIALLQPYINTQPAKTTREDLAWLYLNFATANQYDRRATIAREYFKKAIAVADIDGLDSIQHYIYHHYGRFLAEKKEYALAKKYFAAALTIRRKLNDKHWVNTQKAIDTLNLVMDRIDH